MEFDSDQIWNIERLILIAWKFVKMFSLNVYPTAPKIQPVSASAQEIKLIALTVMISFQWWNLFYWNEIFPSLSMQIRIDLDVEHLDLLECAYDRGLHW